MSPPHQAVQSHYAVGDLEARVLAALQAAGKDLDHLAPADLAPLDAFHIRGRDATRELALRSHLEPSHEVLDVGCGVGGSARFLAAECGCRVTGIDLSEEYCQVAAMLSARCGLGALTTFHAASALDLPLEDERFDIAWTEHVQMNIADKRRFYGEIARVLKTGGRLMFHDVFQGPGGDPHYPVPWAGSAAISHLESVEAVARVLESLGFARQHWEDVSQKSLAWYEARVRALKEKGPPPLGTHLLMGADAGQKFRNVARNLREARIVVVQAVFGK